MTEYDKTIKNLLETEGQKSAQIARTQHERDALSLITGDADVAAMDDGLRQRIEENTQDLYKTAKELNNNSSVISD